MAHTVHRADTLEEVGYDPDEHDVLCEFCGEVGDGSMEDYIGHMADVHNMSRDEFDYVPESAE